MLVKSRKSPPPILAPRLTKKPIQRLPLGPQTLPRTPVASPAGLLLLSTKTPPPRLIWMPPKLKGGRPMPYWLAGMPKTHLALAAKRRFSGLPAIPLPMRILNSPVTKTAFTLAITLIPSPPSKPSPGPIFTLAVATSKMRTERLTLPVNLKGLNCVVMPPLAVATGIDPSAPSGSTNLLLAVSVMPMVTVWLLRSNEPVSLVRFMPVLPMGMGGKGGEPNSTTTPAPENAPVVDDTRTVRLTPIPPELVPGSMPGRGNFPAAVNS